MEMTAIHPNKSMGLIQDGNNNFKRVISPDKSLRAFSNNLQVQVQGQAQHQN